MDAWCACDVVEQILMDARCACDAVEDIYSIIISQLNPALP